MGDFEKSQICQKVGLQWVFMETKDDVCKYDLIESASDDSLESSSSKEMMEDTSSSSSCSPLFELSELMAQLPIKRGLSKFYQGKSESFASLTSVKSIEDLEKKGKYCCRSRRSSMKIYGQSQRLSPKATIAKNKKASSSSSSTTTTRSSIFSSLGKMSSLMAN